MSTYYDKLYEWNLRHRWHTESSGAILSDVYFQLIEDIVEISWNNLDCEDDVEFIHDVGGVYVPKTQFYSEINSFLREYENHWFG